MEDKTSQQYEQGRGTLATYIIGYLLSLELTLAAYLLAHRHVASHHAVFSHGYLIAAIAVLAIMQLVVQLVAFLHLGSESKPRWNFTVFIFALITVVIVVAGSIWIMSNLNYNMSSSPEQINKYINSQGNL